RASRRSRALPPRGRRRGPAPRRPRVRSRVLLERDRARGSAAPGGVRGRAAPRGPGLVRADARVLLPGRAALAAAWRALAAAAAAQGLLAPGRGRRVGRSEEHTSELQSP